MLIGSQYWVCEFPEIVLQLTQDGVPVPHEVPRVLLPPSRRFEPELLFFALRLHPRPPAPSIEGRSLQDPGENYGGSPTYRFTIL